MRLTGSVTFPLKFCHHRWLENLRVAQRALEMRPSLILYVQKIAGKVVPNPGTSSFAVMQDFAEDQLTVAKLSTFVSIAQQQVTPFLVEYQSDRPLTPFLAEDMHSLMRGLMVRFVKGAALEGLTKQQLANFDISNDEDHPPQQS